MWTNDKQMKLEVNQSLKLKVSLSLRCTVGTVNHLSPPPCGRSHTHTPPSLFQTHSHMRLEFLPEETHTDEWVRGWIAALRVSPSNSRRRQTRVSGLRPAAVSVACVMSWGCGLKYLFSLPPTLQQAGVCALRAPDDFSRLEMVQRLAKDGYRFLQNQNYRLPDRSAQVGRSLLAPEPVGMATAGQGSH